MHPRLGIIVPYRDRKENLAAFIPHMQRFFAEDELNKSIPVRMLVVEQTPGLIFNRGAIRNIGFKYLSADVDYVCFHDVDLVPVTADYRWPHVPAMIVFHGLQFSPEFIRQLFGGVVVMQKQHFEAANGYSLAYWGWGYEDVDLKERLFRCNLRPEHREGRFDTLPHVDEGTVDGAPTEAHLRNKELYTGLWFERIGSSWRRRSNPADAWKSEGLNSLDFEEVEPRALLRPPAASDRVMVERVVVSLRHRPPEGLS